MLTDCNSNERPYVSRGTPGETTTVSTSLSRLLSKLPRTVFTLLCFSNKGFCCNNGTFTTSLPLKERVLKTKRKSPNISESEIHNIPLMDPNSHFDQRPEQKHLSQAQVLLLLFQTFPNLQPTFQTSCSGSFYV